MPDELSTLRSQLEDHRKRLRELNRQCRVVLLRTFNYDQIAETRATLSELLMVEGGLRNADRRERDALFAEEIERLEAEVEELERLVAESPAPEGVATPADEERLADVRGRGDQLADTISAVRRELDNEILREQQEVQKIFAALDVEQRALDEYQTACADLERALAAVEAVSSPEGEEA